MHAPKACTCLLGCLPACTKCVSSGYVEVFLTFSGTCHIVAEGCHQQSGSSVACNKVGCTLRSHSAWQKACMLLLSFVIVLQARRTKEILSANTEAPFIVEELLDGKDFRSNIKRQDFEDLAGSFFERAAKPLQHLLQRNGLSAGDVHAVELLGGGSRIPKLQAELGHVLNGRVLDK